MPDRRFRSDRSRKNDTSVFAEVANAEAISYLSENFSKRIASDVKHLLSEWPNYHPEVFYEPEKKILFVSSGDWEVPENSHAVEGGYPDSETVYNLLSKIDGVESITQEAEAGPSDEEGNFIKISPWKAAHPVESVINENINWDRDDGIGAVPDQGSSNIGYKAYETTLTVDQFLNLNPAPDERKSSRKSLPDVIKRGEAIAPPFLIINWDGSGWMVRGHEVVWWKHSYPSLGVS
jgi:hypothetical protein